MNKTSKYKAAVIGPGDVVAGLRALGLDVFEATNESEAVGHIKTIKEQAKDGSAAESYAIVLVLESLVKEMSNEDFVKLTKGDLPAILSIPGIEGSSGDGEKRIKELTERALGSSIL